MDLDASINLLVMSRLGRFIEDVGVVGQLHAEPGRDNRREASLVHLMCEPAREDERMLCCHPNFDHATHNMPPTERLCCSARPN